MGGRRRWAGGGPPWFRWPAPSADRPPGVGEAVGDLMGARGWPGAARWARRASTIAPTIVGGSKKHGGADLGPTRAKRAWAELGVDGLGLADEPPGPWADPALTPRLTCEMVARLQGWQDEWGWEFTGRKTARYRQVGNAFPPPVAEAVGGAIRRALRHEGDPYPLTGESAHLHDPVFAVLRARDAFLTAAQIAAAVRAAAAARGTPGAALSRPAVLRRLEDLGRDFHVEMATSREGTAYRLGEFKAFLGQPGHVRHERFSSGRATIS